MCRRYTNRHYVYLYLFNARGMTECNQIVTERDNGFKKNGSAAPLP